MKSFFIVPRYWLFILSGLLWSIAGSILLWRAIGWIADIPIEGEIVTESVGMGLGIVLFFVSFKKIAQRYRSRISSLPEKVAVYKFISRKSALMILGMVTFGIILRLSPFPKHYLAVLYTAMGETLWFGSFLFYTSWIKMVSAKERIR
jgi:hypothetical protein